VSAATVRRLEAQLDGASSSEVAALRSGGVNLALYAVIARHVDSRARGDVVRAVAGRGVGAKEMEALLSALGWRDLAELGPAYRSERLQLLGWAIETLADLPKGHPKQRMVQLALRLPHSLASAGRVAGARR
jgi:hypothetical protein